MEEDEEIVKILLMGDTEVGKSAMVDRFVKNEAQRKGVRPTSSVYDPDVIVKTVTLDGKRIKAYIHDPRVEGATGTNPGLTSSIIYRNVDVVILVFSVDNQHSLDALQDCWVTEFVTFQRITDAAWVVVGNKNDRPLEIDKAILEQLCSRLPDCVSIYTSAKTGNNIDEAFHLAIRKAYKKRAQKGTLIRLHSLKPTARNSLASNNATGNHSDGDGGKVKKAGCSC